MSSAPQQRYRILERLASGGMAEVYIAESKGIEGFKKQVAIKRVLPHLSEKKRFIAMFLDEARLSARLTHSNVVQVFDIGVGDNVYFIVMEYVDGSDLKGVIEHMKKEERAFPVECAVFIAAKICEGLAYAHELTSAEGKPLAIVHRDMSPPNVLLTKYGEVKIVDFGLAKATSQLEKSEAGIIKGKFSYLSPEAAQGEDVDHRTDIFAVGIILWEMLAGRRLFLGETDFQTVKQVQAAKIPPLSKENPAVSPKLDKIIAKALARVPAERYATSRDFARDLVSFLYEQGKPVSAFDVADLVVGAMKRRKIEKPNQGVMIDRLIEEALFDFKSLQEEEERRASQPEPAPKATGAFEDIMDWASEISLGSTQPVDKSAVPWAELAEAKAKAAAQASAAGGGLLDLAMDPPKIDVAKPAEKVEELSTSQVVSVPPPPDASDIDVGIPKDEPSTTHQADDEPAAKETPAAKDKPVPKDRPPVSEQSAKEKRSPKRDGADDGPQKSGAITKESSKGVEAASESGGGSSKVLLVVAAIVLALIGAWLGGLFNGNP